MKRFVLFSTPTKSNIEQVLDALLPASVSQKIFGYVPSAGSYSPAKYENYWRTLVEQRDWQFITINNSQNGKAAATERKKLGQCASLLITGGNTFTLLNNLRRSGLDQSIREFAQKQEYIIGGFSAGAIVLTPTIALAGSVADYDDNSVGLTDLTGLNLLDFEIFPHFEAKYQAELEKYQQQSPHQVKTVTDEQVLIINQDEN